MEYFRDANSSDFLYEDGSVFCSMATPIMMTGLDLVVVIDNNTLESVET